MNSAATHANRLDFWKFWSGQTISNFGSSISQFALPLLVFKLTGSALNLAIAGALAFVPYLLFGLIVGAWVDRLDRKRLMVVTDVLRAAVIASVALAYIFGVLSVGWIYAAGFLSSTLSIFFNSAEFAAIPTLVETDDLVTANGRIQASFSAATVAGPFVAGLAIALMPISGLFFADAATFLVSAFSILLIRRSFNSVGGRPPSRHIVADVMEGLRYVFGHPVLRNISLMMAVVNFVASGAYAEVVLFAKVRLSANDTEVGWVFSAGGIGVVILGLCAGPLRKRLPFSRVALGALILGGVALIAMSQLRSYWPAIVLWGAFAGLGALFNINTSSLRQAIVPNHLLGRVISVAGVLAWSAIPLGTLTSGFLIHATGRVATIYLGMGILCVLIPAAFAFTALGRAEDFLPGRAEAMPDKAQSEPA